MMLTVIFFFSARKKSDILGKNFLLLSEYHNDVYRRRAHFDEVRVVFSPLGHYHNCVVDDDTDDVDIYIFARGSISQSCLSQESSG